jgi:hypothetical protein
VLLVIGDNQGRFCLLIDASFWNNGILCRQKRLTLLALRCTLVSECWSQRRYGQVWSGVQGRSLWGESPQAFDYKRKVV